MSDISDAMGGDFDANSVEPATGFEPLPAGWYPCQIDGAEVKDTKAGNGKYLKLELSVVGDKFSGRKLWPNINLANPNQKAVEIAHATLSAICRAVGVLRPGDSVELHDKPLMVTVLCKKRGDTGEIQNQIGKYESLGSAPGIGAPSSVSAPPQSTAPNTPPWQRK